MLSNYVEQSDDSHPLAICDDVTAEEFEALCGSKIRESDGDTNSEWEKAEN